MAHKIPVGGTIAHAYGFGFGNILNNLGAMWIPAAIMYAIMFVFSTSYANTLTSMSTNPQAALAGLQYLFLGMIVFGVLIVAQIAGIMKEALGLRTGNAWLQFPFGAATWRLIGAYLLYFIVLIVLYIGVFVVSLLFTGIAAGVAGVGAGAGGSARGAIAGLGIAAIVFGLFVFCAFIYIATRLSFLLAPVAVAEHRISLFRAWELTKGNFWRIFVVFLAIVMPLFVLEVAAIGAVYGSSLIPPMHPGVTPEELNAFSQHQRQVMANSQNWWFVTYPLGLLVSVIFYGIFAGAMAFAYRAVTASDHSAEVF
jgi:hypothetical protein